MLPRSGYASIFATETNETAALSIALLGRGYCDLQICFIELLLQMNLLQPSVTHRGGTNNTAADQVHFLSTKTVPGPVYSLGRDASFALSATAF
jgi:hypothetical protein